MLRKFSFFIVLIFFIGCGGGSNIGNNTIKGAYIPSTYLKFKPVLDKAMLQCPTSEFNETYSRHYGDFEGFSSKYFYYGNSDLFFHMCGNHNRSELRFKDEFYINDDGYKILEAKLKLYPNSDEFTFLQLHGIKEGLNKPVLRVIFYEGKIKLFVFDGADYLKKDLGYISPDFINFKIQAGYGRLIVYKDGVLELNVSVNYPDKCYYKLGVYLQRDGCADAEFNNIKVNF